MMAALPDQIIPPMTRALFLLGVSYRLRRIRRLALSGRCHEGERVAARVSMELEQFRDRHGCVRQSTGSAEACA